MYFEMKEHKSQRYHNLRNWHVKSTFSTRPQCKLSIVNDSFLFHCLSLFCPKTCKLIWLLILLQDVYRFLLLLYARGFCSLLIYLWTFHGVHTIPEFFGVSFIKITDRLINTLPTTINFDWRVSSQWQNPTIWVLWIVSLRKRRQSEASQVRTRTASKSFDKLASFMNEMMAKLECVWERTIRR